MATKIKGLGSKLYVKSGGGFVLIAQRASIDPPTVDIDMKEVTDLDDTYVTRRPTLPDPKECGLKIWLDPNDATHTYLRASNAAASSTAEDFQLIFPSSPSAIRAFSGYIQSYKEGGVDPKGYLEADLKIQLTGPIVYSTGT